MLCLRIGRLPEFDGNLSSIKHVNMTDTVTVCKLRLPAGHITICSSAEASYLCKLQTASHLTLLHTFPLQTRHGRNRTASKLHGAQSTACTKVILHPDADCVRRAKPATHNYNCMLHLNVALLFDLP